MITRSKAPLRIGLAGGGTDVSPYSDRFGGAVLNATISLYACATIGWLDRPEIIIEAGESGTKASYAFDKGLPLDGHLDLQKAVYNCVQADFGGIDRGFWLSTRVDAPAGSGLGSSSTLVVAILGAFVKWLMLPLDEYEIADYAYRIERAYLGWPGGKQDQYAATFGGFNFMEFGTEDKVIVNPLGIRPEVIDELEQSLLLYYTATSRQSVTIIKDQIKHVLNDDAVPVNATHQLRQQAFLMKEILLQGRLSEMGPLLDYGFEQKKKIASAISNPLMEEIYLAAKTAGATGGKVSGAGGGGFMVFYCPGATKYRVQESLRKFGGHCRSFHFEKKGLRTWSI